MIFENERGHQRCVKFGADYRGMDCDEIFLEIRDLHDMLSTPEHKLKSKIHQLLRFMERNHHRSGRGPYEDPYEDQRRYPSQPQKLWELPGPEGNANAPISWDEAAKIMRANSGAASSRASSWVTRVGSETGVVIGVGSEKKPTPDASGLLWQEEEDKKGGSVV